MITTKTKTIHVRAFPVTTHRLKQLADHFGISESGIIQLAINDLMIKEGLMIDHSKKLSDK